MELEFIRWPTPDPPAEEALRAQLAREGFDSFEWTDAPAARYGEHSHDRDESIWLVCGAIVFAVSGDEFVLEPGDRLMLPAGTPHTARVGPRGATYLIGEHR